MTINALRAAILAVTFGLGAWVVVVWTIVTFADGRLS